MSFRKAALWTLIWSMAAAAFAGGVYYFEGQAKAVEFVAGYLIELSLSMDNLFLFLMLFSTFRIEAQFQRRILNWGLLGAVLMRLIFIILGIAMVEKFHWLMYVFGALLLVTAVKMVVGKEKESSLEDNWAIRLLRKLLPITMETHGNRFFTKISGVLHATPLFVVLLLIESTDLLFAVDSIPAVFAVTTDPLIVYSSNVLAILGLRSLYFFLERVQSAFYYVKYAVALILAVTGIKMLLTFWSITIPVGAALGIIAAILGGSIVLSVFFGKKHQAAHAKI